LPLDYGATGYPPSREASAFDPPARQDGAAGADITGLEDENVAQVLLPSF